MTTAAPKNLSLFLINLVFLLVISGTRSADAQTAKATSAWAVSYLEKPFSLGVSDLKKIATVALSRGETRSAMIRLTNFNCDVPIVIKNSNLPSDITLQMFDLMPYRATPSSYQGGLPGETHDPLIPVNARSRCANPQSKERWFVIDVRASEKAIPGNYRAEIVYSDVSVPLEIVVWKMVMPSQFALPLYSELTPWFLSLGHFGEWNSQEASLTRQYIKNMLSHRILPLKAWTRFPAVSDFEAKSRMDWDSFPNAEQSFPNTVANLLPPWALLDMPFPGESRNIRTARRWWSGLHKNLSPASWKNRTISYLWDEPKVEDFSRVKELSAIVAKEAPEVRRLVTVYPHASLLGAVDIFVPLIGQLKGNENSLLTRPRQELWAYVACGSHACGEELSSGEPDFIIDRSASYIRSIAPLASLYKLKAFLYYHTVYAYKKYPKIDPWKSVYDFTGHGEGTLYYPGRPGEHGLSKHMPIESLRLKIWRDTSFDAEYFRWMEQTSSKPSWWEPKMKSLAKSAHIWSKNIADYETTRMQIGKFLNESTTHMPKLKK